MGTRLNWKRQDMRNRMASAGTESVLYPRIRTRNLSAAEIEARAADDRLLDEVAECVRTWLDAKEPWEEFATNNIGEHVLEKMGGERAGAFTLLSRVTNSGRVDGYFHKGPAVARKRYGRMTKEHPKIWHSKR